MNWYAQFGRATLPWRADATPYRVVVSEFMLQQTQVDRVRPLFEKFMAQFASFEELAAAPRSEVVRLWQGLGYNSRAVRLHELARTVVREYSGALPSDPELLAALPGVGPYTQSAIRAFAFSQHAVAIDTNLRRVLYRVFYGIEFPRVRLGAPSHAYSNASSMQLGHRAPVIQGESLTSGMQLIAREKNTPARDKSTTVRENNLRTDEHLRPLHEDIQPKNSEIEARAFDMLGDVPSNVWNAAMMDLGASICTARAPKCLLCPLLTACTAAPIDPDELRSRALAARRPPAVRFENSTRFVRGRIVDHLRELEPAASISFLDLHAAILPRIGARDAGEIAEIISALERDGLVVVRAEGIALAD